MKPEALVEARGWFWDFAGKIEGMADAGRLVEKLPLNIIELGLAARLFPGAPIIVALRDPRDVVLSCFMQEFHLNDAMAHFTTLEGAARLYALVMDLWFQCRTAPELNWMEYKYEDLVTAPEATTRKVFDFIGENWIDDVLDYRGRRSGRPIDTPSREALNEPIYTRAVGRWRAWEHHLAPVLPILAPYVSALGYDAISR
jgi:hypothetical protein